jgi:hypothetical protein
MTTTVRRYGRRAIRPAAAWMAPPRAGPPTAAATAIPAGPISTDRLAADALDAWVRRNGAPPWVIAAGAAEGEALRETADPVVCDALYDALGLTEAAARVSRTGQWAGAAFARSLGSLLGRFEYVDAWGRPTGGPGSPDVRGARFEPLGAEEAALRVLDALDARGATEALKGRAAGIDEAVALAARLWACAAGAATGQPSEARRETALEPAREREAARRLAAEEALEAGRVRLLTARNAGALVSGPEARLVPGVVGPGLPPLQYYLQEIQGDGACLYRSLASALVQALTGHNLGRGVTFPADVQRGVLDAWRGENYGAQVRPGAPLAQALAVALNGVTKWVKFYVYLVMCSDDIPPEAISYTGGVREGAVQRIRPMTSIADMLAPDAVRRIMGEDDGSGAAPVVHEVPTLDLIVRYAAWFVQALANSAAPGGGGGGGLVQTLTWEQVWPYAEPLLAVPWDAAGPQRALPAGKAIRYWDAIAGDEAVSDIEALLLESSAEYLAALDAVGGDLDVAYQSYCANMRQSVRWGGTAEVAALASVLYPDVGSPALGGLRGVVVFNYSDPSQATALVPEAVPSRPSADPLTGRPVRRDFRPDALAVLFSSNHYVALHPVRVDPLPGAGDGGPPSFSARPYAPPMDADALVAFAAGDEGVAAVPRPAIDPTRWTLPGQGLPERQRPASAYRASLAAPLPALLATALPPPARPRSFRPQIAPPAPLPRVEQAPARAPTAFVPAAMAPRAVVPLGRRRPMLAARSGAPPAMGPPLERAFAPRAGFAAAPSPATAAAAAPDAMRLLAAVVDDMATATGIDPDLLRDSADTRDQFLAVAEASGIGRAAAQSAWARFARFGLAA